MSEIIANNIESLVAYAPTWGYLIIVLLMAVESSFIPFPSEVVMIPAGFLACRRELSFGIPALDFVMVLVLAVVGSLLGAYINYWLALKLGRPFLHKYGKCFFLSPATLDRSEEIFRKYGDITTFVCRLLPAIRQLISLPAGLCRMDLKRFSLFTALGAGFWSLILQAVGWYLGHLSENMTYPELVARGTAMIHDHYGIILVGLVLVAAAYLILQKTIMKSKACPSTQEANE